MTQKLTLLFNEARLSGLVDSLDDLHTAISEGRTRQVTSLTDAELTGWLYELVYLATEAISEISHQQQQSEAAPLQVVPKSEAS
ncbi:MAG: hypothetical protein KME04_12840 [Pleurocapsa minor GSE-CHR-MK-17-07R]|jgi:hypothetical protein|nr:hypothetical protein [Pleurocapsa minor GSE-CHR-MK 17-07R]